MFLDSCRSVQLGGWVISITGPCQAAATGTEEGFGMVLVLPECCSQAGLCCTSEGSQSSQHPATAAQGGEVL